MPWQVSILLQNVFASFYAIESRALAHKYKEAHFQILSVVFAFVYIVFVVYALLNRTAIHVADSVPYFPLITGVATAFTIWTVLTFLAVRYVDAAIGSLLTVFNLLGVVVVASLVIGERLTTMQLLGSALLLLSIFVIHTAKRTNNAKRNYLLAIGLTLLASICFGVAISGEKYILDHIGGPTYALVGIGAQFVGLLIPAMFFHRSQFKHFQSAVFRRRVFIMGLVRGGAGLLFILSLVKANNASLVGMLSGLKIVLTTLLGAIILKETAYINRKYIAASIACIGVGMLMW